MLFYYLLQAPAREVRNGREAAVQEKIYNSEEWGALNEFSRVLKTVNHVFSRRFL